MTFKQSRIITTVLSPAVRLWLRSQVEQVEELEVKIDGGDRQIFTGHIPRVFLSARSAVYQGLHLSQVELTGESIRLNLREIVKGKPLRLLDPLPVRGELLLLAADLQNSLDSPLLSAGLRELVRILLQSGDETKPPLSLENWHILWSTIDIDTDKFKLGGTITDGDGNTTPLVIYAGLQLANSRELRIELLHLQLPPEFPEVKLASFDLDLGTEVTLEELTIIPGQIVCRGGLKVMP